MILALLLAASLPEARVITRENMLVLLQNTGKRLSDRRAEAKEETESHRRILPGTVAAMWLTAGYASVSTSTAVTRGATSGFASDLGGHLFFRALGPLYFGGLVDYSLSGPNGLLAGAGVRVALADFALSGGFGYADLAQSAGTGVGALGAVDFGVSSGLSLRLQGSWRRGKTTPGGLAATEVTTTVWSAMGGLSLQF